jgi:hypothetical protein
MTEQTLDEIKKENQKLKSELNFIQRNDKADTFLLTTIYSIVAALVFTILMAISRISEYAIGMDPGISYATWFWIHIFLVFVNIFGYFFIVWHWAMTICWNYSTELAEIGEDIRKYMHAGQKALSESKKPVPNKKPKPAKKTARDKSGKFSKTQ